MRAGVRISLLRVGLVVAGLLGAAVLVEGGLQLASLFVGARSASSIGGDRAHVVICAGDSHTYGYPCGAEEAYPGRLQVELDRRAPGRYRVLNLGLPGMSSSQVRAYLPQWIDRYRAEAVIVCVGMNNSWNVSETESSGRSSWVHRSVQSLRLYRLLRLLLRRLPAHEVSLDHFTGRPEIQRVLKDNGRVGVEQRDPHSGKVLVRHHGDPSCPEKELSETRTMLWNDLEIIKGTLQRRGVRLILLTYAATPLPDRPETARFRRHERLGDVMRRFARERGVSIVDLRDRFLDLLSGGVPWETYFSGEANAHPNAQGYAEIALAVADAIGPPALIPQGTRVAR